MRLIASAAIGTVALGMLIVPAPLAAQFRGRGGPGGEGGRSFDPTEMLRNMDANKNGMIEPSEMAPNRSAFFVRGAAQRAGMDLTKPLPIDKLTAAMQQGRDERSRDGDRSREGDRPREDRPRDDRRRDEEQRSDRGTGPGPGSFPPGGSGAPPSTKGTPSSSAGVVGFGAPAAGSSGGVTGFGGGTLEQKYDSRVISYVNDMLARYDKNKDGYMDSEEWKANRWTTPPEDSDLNKDKRLSKEELCIRLAKRFGSPPGGNSSSAPPGGSSVGGDSSGSGDQNRRYAESLLKQYDKNGDGKLERDEWQQMRPEHHSADANSDGTITTEELSVRLASYATAGPTTSGSSAPGSRGPATSSSSTGRVRRFLLPAERLPAGLPTWFLEKDADQDGQVMMAEYATSWSESVAADFARCDLNGDGIITAKECLKVEGSK